MMRKYDGWHLLIGLLLAGLSIASLCFGWNIHVSLWLVVLMSAYVAAMIIECARRSIGSKSRFLRLRFALRTWALLLMVLLVVANVTVFANIYLKSKNVTYNGNDEHQVLNDKTDAIYFSAVTLTTLGYGDFAPTENARIYVLFQLSSGLLLLFYALPIVAARISIWDNVESDDKKKIPAYIVIRIRAAEPEKLKDYQLATPKIIENHHGKFLARGGKVVTLEGTDESRRIVIIEFPSLADAEAFYHSPEYAEARKLREGIAEAEFIAVEGVQL